MSKRLLACMVLAALLVSVLPVAALAETYATVISDDVLHLRDAPGVDGNIIGKYRNGTRVEVLNTGYRYWVRVRTPDKQVGYMYKQYLSSFTRTSSGSSTTTSRSSSGSTVTLGTGFRYVVKAPGPAPGRNHRLGHQRRGHLVQRPVQRDPRLDQDQIPDQIPEIISSFFPYLPYTEPKKAAGSSSAGSLFTGLKNPAASRGRILFFSPFPGHSSSSLP